jgi:aryl-alcohol dehydrogenase-like predicted oxidoreductase
MEKVLPELQIPGINIKIPVMGFGCSSLTSIARKKALRLLDSAFDVGIRHFDVARYYGYGETESILGAFVKSRRAQVTVTTKFGIEPPRRTNALRIALGMGRRFLRFVPSARKIVQKHVPTVLKGNAFSVADAQRNLEISLRELGTDYIDFYLLHDYVAGVHPSDELVAFLRQAVKAGKIRQFGLGTSVDSIMRALDCEPDLCGVIQCQNSVLTRNLDKLPSQSKRGLVITHGALAGAYGCLSSFLKADANRAQNWSKTLDLDCADERILAALLLNYVIDANPKGMVLFSARNTARIRHNAKSVLERRVTPTQVNLFARLVERDLTILGEHS